ncbi:MAG TPA: hypothetical protein PLW65_34220 [Pseudomonadota bacterium]|nr:hypothetical protein [Pseudomonadota bacterium]
MRRALLALGLTAAAIATGFTLSACGGGNDDDRLQLCLDRATLKAQSMCMGAGCCAQSTLETEAE